MHQISPYTLKVDWDTFFENPTFLSCTIQFIWYRHWNPSKTKIKVYNQKGNQTDGQTGRNQVQGVEIIWSLRTSPGNDGQTETIFWGSSYAKKTKQ